MSQPTIIDNSEPFGQRGVRQYLRPLVMILCAVGVIVSAFMMARSDAYYDSIYRAYDGKRIEIASIIGRLVITVGARPIAGQLTSGAWEVASQPIGEVADGWQPSWKKTLGIEWGYENEWSPWRITPTSYWRLRIRWRTILLLYLTPLLWETLRRRLAPSLPHQPTPAAT